MEYNSVSVNIVIFSNNHLKLFVRLLVIICDDSLGLSFFFQPVLAVFCRVDIGIITTVVDLVISRWLVR